MNNSQKTLLEGMKQIHKVAIDNNLNYSLESGSALGAIREGGFIEWDDDMDILVPLNTYNHFIELLKNNLSYKVVDGLNDKGNELIFTRVYCDEEIFIDIVPFTMSSKKRSISLKIWSEIKWFRKINLKKKVNNRFERYGFYILKSLLNLIPDSLIRNRVKKNVKRVGEAKGDNFFPFWNALVGANRDDRKIVLDTSQYEMVKFEDAQFMCFKDVKNIMKLYFGDDYMTPRREKYSKGEY